MRKKTAIILGLFFIILISINSIAENKSGTLVNEVTRKVSDLYDLKKSEFSGMAYSIFNSQGILHSEGFGTSSWLHGKIIAPDKSQFRFSSISKLVTTVAVAQLVQSGVLSLNTSITDIQGVAFIDYLRKNETPERLKKWSKIEIKHLLSHQAGISKDLPGARIFWNSDSLLDNSYPSFKTFRRGLLKTEFIYPAGATEGAVKYSNLGMNLLARIIEGLNRENLSFPQYVKKHIFSPPGMNRSAFNVSPQNHANLVTGYGTHQPGTGPLKIPHVFDVSSYDGSIGIAAPVNDMAKLGNQFLRATLFKKNLIFKSDTAIQQFLSPIPHNSFLSKSRVMASGPFWRFRPMNKHNAENLWLGFTGFGYAFESILLMNPIYDFGIVLAINSTTSSTFYFWDAIVKILESHRPVQVGQKTKNLTKDARINIVNSENDFQFNQIDRQTVSREQLLKFEGTYHADNLYKGPTAEIKIDEENGQFHLTFHGRKLIPRDIDTGKFRFEKGPDVLFNGEPAVFQMDPSGNVTSVVIAHVKELKYVNGLKE
ncbi:hypothetical protein COB52_04320 [Candidatus Kaiserbacteria bacterium]|nr:MAG: hypothetical protein COB52_04320 [Candidatus Kaiserbacteria bacterium]